MGVPGFNTWMRTQYVGAYVPQRSSFDHVYVDMASILHTVLRKGMQCYVACSFLLMQPSTPYLSLKKRDNSFQECGGVDLSYLSSQCRAPCCKQQYCCAQCKSCVAGLRTCSVISATQPQAHVVWPAARNVSRFHIALYRQLDEVLSRTHPRKSVVFALDGPAPLAKLLTQRCGPNTYNQLCAAA